jgi:hypothetical protein
MFARLLMVACGSFFLLGCDSGVPTLSGRATMDGKALDKVLIVVLGPNNKTASGSTDADGNYKVENPPVGPVKIQVIDPPRESKTPRPGLSFGMPPTAGLDYDVKPGSQKYDIEWKPIVKGK